MNEISSAVAWLKPMLRSESVMRGAISPHAGPSEKPSNDVVPIIVHSSATVPGTASSVVRPLSGSRRYSASRVQRSGDMRANRPK